MGIVLITGASGLVGSALTSRLIREGVEAIPLPRKATCAVSNSISWDPKTGEISLPSQLEIDAVVHLAGESIASGRWTEAKKQRLWESRIQPTKLLCEFLSRRDPKPSLIISASAVGYYGNRDNESLNEQSSPGAGYLADLGKAWEEATSPASTAGIRVVNLRIGIVLSKDGGALAKMLPVFKLGLGGTLGSGNQIMSWVALEDLISIIVFAINNKSLRGPINATSPNPITNKEFTTTLAKILRRSAIFPVPALALKILFGQMANEALLAGQGALPQELQKAGFKFQYPNLNEALAAAIV